MTIIIIIVIIVFILAMFIGGYNSFIHLKNSVEEAFSTMDVYLKRRYDLIPNLVETVKGYTTYESGTLEKIVEARSRAMSGGSVQERTENENVLSGALKSLFALAENYPQLKADTNFLNLQQELSGIETDIAQSRKYYNGVVRAMNTKVEMFPSNIIAAIFNFNRYPFFIVDDEAERQNVRVDFKN